MELSDYVNRFAQLMLTLHHERTYKLAIDTGFTCHNREGTPGRGSCTFCNNVTFSPNGRMPDPICTRLDNGRRVLAKRTAAKKFLSYFQVYTDTEAYHMLYVINPYTKHP